MAARGIFTASPTIQFLIELCSVSTSDESVGDLLPTELLIQIFYHMDSIDQLCLACKHLLQISASVSVILAVRCERVAVAKCD